MIKPRGPVRGKNYYLVSRFLLAGKKQSQIAKDLGISRERVRQLGVKAGILKPNSWDILSYRIQQ